LKHCLYQYNLISFKVSLSGFFSPSITNQFVKDNNSNDNVEAKNNANDNEKEQLSL